ncbi:hypothetical protein CC80DRAFT_493495 [Byssothecium circinans]|uniref:Uncharacterized protein n=1 Tax=Byssothecium circinans TaxID=147558 RepID=A0A6A5TPS9_9PLEO|nr:hypothetical protein CC80DRAFT_493495 [Byssothecium circinans]
MEDHAQERYRDSPTPSRSPSPVPTSTPSSRASTAKPLPSAAHDLAAQPLRTYRDEPTNDEYDGGGEDEVPFISLAAPASTPRQRSTSEIPPSQVHTFIPYTDAVPENDGDVPLAHLYPYPTEAPPSYHVAVRESFRDTLIRHIPSHSVSTEADEEAGVEHAQADDVRFTVERFVAAIIVSTMLLVIAALLALVVVTSLRTGH